MLLVTEQPLLGGVDLAAVPGRSNIRPSRAGATGELRVQLPTLTPGAELAIQVLDRTHLIRQRVHQSMGGQR